MSEEDDSQNTRPISVAELLARNGTIGAPPAGGRRRRRRGNADAISVAELTGEIPVIRDEPPVVEEVQETEEIQEVQETEEIQVVQEIEEVSVDEPVEEVSAETVVIYSGEEESASEVIVDDEPAVDEDDEDDEVIDEDVVEDEVTEDEVTEEDAAEEDGAKDEVTEEDVAEEDGAKDEVVEDQVAEDEDLEEGDLEDEDLEEEGGVDDAVDEDVVEESEVVAENPPLSEEPLPSRQSGPVLSEYPRPVPAPSDAEEMAPDPVDESIDLDELLAAQGEDPEELRSYLQASSGALFSGDTLADDIARRGPVTEVISETVPDSGPSAVVPSVEGGRLGGLRQALAAVFQSVLAVLLGAGLFLGFDQLWRWNTIVALVLSVLVILSLVIAVRVLRKTEDIASTLIAVAVGALVTLGPLALLQST